MITNHAALGVSYFTRRATDAARSSGLACTRLDDTSADQVVCRIAYMQHWVSDGSGAFRACIPSMRWQCYRMQYDLSSMAFREWNSGGEQSRLVVLGCTFIADRQDI